MTKIKYINLTEDEFHNGKPLFKVVSLENFLNSIEQFQRLVSKQVSGNYLWFSNPEQWKDPFESLYINGKYGPNKQDFPLKGRCFCSCFSDTRSCEPQWNMYSDKQIAVQMKITREHLVEELEKLSDCQVFIGKVHYQQVGSFKADLTKNSFLAPFNINDIESCIKLLLLKRNAYVYEDEIRVFVIPENKSNKKGIPMVYGCQPMEMIQEIVFDPNIGAHTYAFIKNALEETLNLGGMFKPKKDKNNRKHPVVKMSRLYEKVKESNFII